VRLSIGLLMAVIVSLLGCGIPSCRGPQGWGRVRILESRLGPSSWTVLADDQGQGLDVLVDGSVRQARCRRTSRGPRCWVSGVREGFHRLAVQVGGRGVARRTALSPPPDPAELVIYSVLLDRFADGEPGNNVRARPGVAGAPRGGDLRGLGERLGYLARLGVNAVLLSPIWDHRRTGRDPQGLPRWVGRVPRDPLRLAPAFGRRQDLMRLLARARRRGIRVLLDLPRGRMGLDRYFAVVRTWLSRTLADGFRLGPVPPGRERAWALRAQALAEDFLPLVLIHHTASRRPAGRRGAAGRPAGRRGAARHPAPQAALRRALRELPRTARIVEVDTGSRWRRWLGCGGQQAGVVPPLRSRSAAVQVARVLSTHRHPVLRRRLRCRAAGGRDPAHAERAAAAVADERARLALTGHLLAADIPVVYYADGWSDPPVRRGLPSLRWPAARRFRRAQRIRRLLALRRAVPALRRGEQQVRLPPAHGGETLVVTRRRGRCRAILLLHRGARTRRLTLDLTALGWPGTRDKGAGAQVELVDRLRGRGHTAETSIAAGEPKLTLSIRLEPRSAVVLVPTERGACSG
jgi:hypothetical protein